MINKLDSFLMKLDKIIEIKVLSQKNTGKKDIIEITSKIERNNISS